ncbi:hypothetical protein [Kitasatospora sp. NPDC050543]|uniref:hypothetical protein n=1 Tax=Kitasatospora sp. NPDC050543 TaxID=3364054 RepID=UPI0037983FEB
MPRGTITITSSDRGGTALPAATTGDPTNGHSIANDGATLLLVENGGSTVARTVTVQIARKIDGLTATAQRTKSIPVGQTQLFGPYDPKDYGSLLLVDVDNAELKIRAIRSA